ncbi:MAG: hypothetical protein KIH63_004025 [Candidatus Saccharibacteria bacterium]|nr:hypothetical protein [Candidatus Saccharibacteria bacterium]
MRRHNLQGWTSQPLVTFRLYLAVFLLTLVFTALRPSPANAVINRQINFQGKIVLSSNSTNITNATYNMQFKIYSGGDGVPGGGDETLLWTEDRLRNASQGVTITDGIFQVNLGAVTTLPGSVDFNNNTLWLSINLGNTNASCTPFASCSGDGEMNPMVRFTAAPYAFNSDMLDGLDSTAFSQLSGNNTWSGTNTFNSQSTFNTDIDYVFSGTENLAVTSDLAGTVDVLSVIATPSSTAGTTQGILVQQANSANTNGLDNGLTINNADADLAITAALKIQNSGGGGYTTIIDNQGTLISGAELNLLDSRNGALVDTDDAVATAITGTGALNAGSITSGFGAIDVGTEGITTTGTIGTAGTTTFTGAGATFSAAINANGGIAFDNASDTLGAHTLAGTVDANNNILTNIGNAGTDFIASTGALTLAGVLTANGGITVAANQDITTTAGTGTLTLNSTVSNASDSALVIAPSFTGGGTDALTYNGISLSAFSPTNAAGTDTVNGLNIGNLTDPGATITSAAFRVGTGWDTILAGTTAGTNIFSFTNFTVSSAGAITAAGAIAANGGITFDNASDTLGAHTLAGTVDANNNIITNIGVAGTDFTVTGGLTLDDILTVNDDLTVNAAAGESVQFLDSAAPTVDLVRIISDAATTTTGVNGLQIDFTTGDGANATNSGLEINLASGGTAAGDIVNALNITMDAADASTQNGIVVGANFDVAFQANSGNIITSNEGIEFTESDTNPTCAAGDYSLYADTSEAKIKKCVNGVVSDVQGEPDVVYISDATNTAWVDSNTTELWNAAGQPNFTPGHTGVELLVMTTIRVQTDPGAGETQPAARIDREIGSTADCADTNTVGGTFGLSDTDNAAGDATSTQTMTNVFVDAPATTSNVSYTVCTSTDSVIAGTNTETRIDFTLFPVNDSADLAEVYPTNDESLTAGEVVSLDPNLDAGVVRSTKAYDASAIGIVSTQPALVIGGRGGEGTSGKPIALSGRVPVRVQGPIKKGDILTSSNTPGVAMKAVKSGAILGVAMTDYDGTGVGTVLTFVKTGNFNGSNLNEIFSDPTILGANSTDFSASIVNYFVNNVTAAAPEDMSDVVADRIAAGLEVLAPQVSTDRLRANTVSPLSGNQLVLDVGAGGRLVLRGLGGEEVAWFDGLGNAELSGSLAIGNGLQINGRAEFNGETMFDELVTFSDDVVFKGRTTFNNDTGGFALIRQGEQEVAVKFARPTDEVPPVVTVSVKNGRFIAHAYKDLTKDGFTIVLNEPATEDTEFSWTALTITDPKLSENQIN